MNIVFECKDADVGLLGWVGKDILEMGNVPEDTEKHT